MVSQLRESLSTAPYADNRPNKRLVVAAAACIALLATIAFGTIPFDRPPFERWDLESYRKMAVAAPGLAPDVPRHFAYRIVGPWLAGVLPVGDPFAFRFLTTAVLVLTAAAFTRFLLRRGIGREAALVATIAFAFNKHMFGYPAWNPFQIGDALAMLALVLAYDALLERRWVRLGAVFLVGMVSRESVFLIVPLAGAFLVRRRLPGVPGTASARDLVPMCTALAPGVVAYLALRVLLPATGQATLVSVFLYHAPKLSRAETWLRLLVHAPAPLAFLPLLFARTTWRFFRDRPEAAVYLVLVFLSTLLGSNNERLMGPAYLVFYWLIADILEVRMFGLRWHRWALAAVAVITSADHLYARWQLPSETFTMWLTVAMLAVASAIAIHAARVNAAEHAE